MVFCNLVNAYIDKLVSAIGIQYSYKYAYLLTKKQAKNKSFPQKTQ